MRFDAVAGQKEVKQGLIRMWQSGRMPHALLLLGREGTGGLPLALAFAQYVLCENKAAEDSCGICANCQKVIRLEHADLHLNFPVYRLNSGKPALSLDFIKEFRQFVLENPYGTTFEWMQFIEAENKQANMSADDCRKIIDALNFKSYEGGMKIQIIWRPEYLGKEGNILLKLIEEPPADTLILFVAESEEEILPTILSRTQLVRLRPIPAQDIADALIRKAGAEARQAAQIGQMADGSYTEALQLMAHMENDLLPSVRSWFNVIFTNNGIGIVQFSEEWSKAGREKIRNLFSYTLHLLEGAVRVSYLPQAITAYPAEEGQFIQRLASRRLSLDSLQKMMELINDASYYIERNAHTKSVLLSCCIKLKDATGAVPARP